MNQRRALHLGRLALNMVYNISAIHREIREARVEIMHLQKACTSRSVLTMGGQRL